VLLAEPSVVALRSAPSKHAGEVVAAGRAALAMIGRTGHDVAVTWPIRAGVIVDQEATHAMLRAFVAAVLGRSVPRRIVISLPCGVTSVERLAFARAAESLGADDVTLVYEPIAAAIGAGLDVLAPRGRLLVDVGSGITEAVVVSMGRIAAQRSVRVGGNTLDERIVEYVRASRGLRISRAMAEELKIHLGAAVLAPEGRVAPAKGQWQASRLPGATLVSSDELRPVFLGVMDTVVECVTSALDAADPELATDVCNEGLYLSGGGMLSQRLDQYLSERLGVRTRLVDDPLRAVALGNGRVLETPDLAREACV
jgi:rod shape-determining protein MreB